MRTGVVDPTDKLPVALAEPRAAAYVVFKECNPAVFPLAYLVIEFGVLQLHPAFSPGKCQSARLAAFLCQRGLASLRTVPCGCRLSIKRGIVQCTDQIVQAIRPTGFIIPVAYISTQIRCGRLRSDMVRDISPL